VAEEVNGRKMAVNILIDSSTNPSSRTNKYGESVAVWGVWRDNEKKAKPLRCGIHYFCYEGPNKTFYQGVIRALEQCLEMYWKEEVIVFGDCKPVIEQLNGERALNKMQKEYRQVQALIKKYKEKDNQIQFQYLDESDSLYRKIDQLSKKSREFIHSFLG